MANNIKLNYLLNSEKDEKWGIGTKTVGYQKIGANELYPPPVHPEGYGFSVHKGRALSEYQLVHIISGKGRFQISKNAPEEEVKAGSILFLAPGQWHNYYPDAHSGWEEYWIGFNGIAFEHYYNHGFYPKDENRHYKIGFQNRVVELFREAIETAQEQPIGFQQVLAGIVHLMLGYVYSYPKRIDANQTLIVEKINKVKEYIAAHIATKIDLEKLAGEYNMSYSLFRKQFRKYTGFSPLQYILEIRILKSKELLTNTSLSSHQIAYECGFDDAAYFCTIFKRKTKINPLDYRRLARIE